MKEDDEVALRGFPQNTGKVVAVHGDTVEVREDATGIRVEHDVADLRPVTSHELPATDDKSWPPRGLESKAP